MAEQYSKIHPQYLLYHYMLNIHNIQIHRYNIYNFHYCCNIFPICLLFIIQLSTKLIQYKYT
jgi:hypothetical protein